MDAGAIQFAVAHTGAFAVGWTKDLELAAYKHPGGVGDWQSVSGLPLGAGPRGEIASDLFAVAPLDEGHAIVVWPAGTIGNLSTRAAFIE